RNTTNAKFSPPQLRLIRKDSGGKVVQRTSKFRACEAASGDYESQQCPPARRVRLSIRALEHFNDMIADADGIQQALEIERILLQIRHPQVVRNSTHGEYQMVVGNLPRW